MHLKRGLSSTRLLTACALQDVFKWGCRWNHSTKRQTQSCHGRTLSKVQGKGRKDKEKIVPRAEIAWRTVRTVSSRNSAATFNISLLFILISALRTFAFGFWSPLDSWFLFWGAHRNAWTVGRQFSGHLCRASSFLSPTSLHEGTSKAGYAIPSLRTSSP